MFFHQLGETEGQRARRMMHVAVFAGALGCVIGGGVVIGAAATVMAVVNGSSQTESRAVAPADAPLQNVRHVEPTAVAATAAKKDCADQTWPYIERRCLKRVDNPARETTATAVAPPPPATDVVATTRPAPARVNGVPAELQVGSPAVPAAPALLAPQSVAMTSPQIGTPPQFAMPPEPMPFAQPAVHSEIVPAVKTPPAKTASAKPVRKTEAPKPAPKPQARPIDEDDDDEIAPTPAIRTVSRVTSRSSRDDEVVIIRRYRAPSLFGGLFGALVN